MAVTVLVNVVVIVRRVEIYGCVNGMDLDRDGLVEDSYIHSLYESEGDHAGRYPVSRPD